MKKISKILKKLCFSLSLLLGGVVPLMAHPGVALPEGFGTVIAIVILVIVGLVYTLSLWASWRVKSLRYMVLVLPLLYSLYGLYMNSNFHKEIVHGERLKEEKKRALALSYIDRAWEVIANEEKVLDIMNHIDRQNLSYAEREAFYLAFYMQDPIKYHDYKIKAYQMNSTCIAFKIALSHLEVKEESIYLDIFSEIKKEELGKKYNVFNNCIPMKKIAFIEKLIKENKFDVLLKFIEVEYHRESNAIAILKNLKKIKDDKVRKELITAFLKNYRNIWLFDSLTDEVKSILDDIPIYELLVDSKNFDSYINIMTSNLKEIRERSLQDLQRRYEKNRNRFRIKEHTKERFLQIKSILDENSSLMKEIPSFVKNHFEEELLKDNNPLKYDLFEKNVRYSDEDTYGRYYYNAPYILYVDGKEVDRSLMASNGYMRYRFKIEDEEKEVTIKCEHDTITDILHSKKELDSRFFDEYWIVDNATFTMDEF